MCYITQISAHTEWKQGLSCISSHSKQLEDSENNEQHRLTHCNEARSPWHHAGLVSIDIEGEGKRNAIVKEIQYKAISSQPLAIDFLGVKAGEKVTVVVPIEAKGDPEGLREGGQLEQVIHELEIEVAPADIPEVLVVDVSALKLDDTLTIAEIALPASAKALHDQTQIVFQVRLPHVVEEPAETEPAPAEGDAAAAAPAAEAK